MCFYLSNETRGCKSTNNSSIKKNVYCNVGYSGHENGVSVSLAASMLGISSLERHNTLDRTMYGSDQSASLDYGMKNLTESLKK